MSGSIGNGINHFYKDLKLSSERLNKVSEQLSVGKEIRRPGDSPSAFDEVARMDIDRARQTAQLESLQSRVSWFQTSLGFLQEIREVLSEMSEYSISAVSSPSLGDAKILDETFQELKATLAQTIDGRGGRSAPLATFGGQALFLGFAPEVYIGADAQPGSDDYEGINLYTGFETSGFSELPLLHGGLGSSSALSISLQGTVEGATASTVTLDANAGSQQDVYVGMTLSITAGSGAGESFEITAYDPNTRVATLDAAFSSIPDSSSAYQIDSPWTNEHVIVGGQSSSIRFAEHVWGADNHRTDQLVDSVRSFEALTDAERLYRQANGIPDIDLEAKTFEEKEARRKENIFDEEYGTLIGKANAERMNDRINNAIKQITQLMTRFDSQVSNIQNQVSTTKKLVKDADAGIASMADVDLASAAEEFGTLVDDEQKMMRLAARLTQNLGRLNDLVKNKGTR
ncbi:MAG: hypothetical protein CMO81_01630 [Waddliaceae bacterium]|nr:hypothetical protein [Waddliaceae bacterium]